MPYRPGHSEAVRRKIVRAARREFNKHGYDAVTIDGVMKAAGLTRGAFYFHFKSKADLFREAIAFILEEHPASLWSPDPSRSPDIRLVDAYLSERHFEEVEESCPLITHAAEAARGDAELKEVFASILRALVDVVSATSRDDEPSEEGLVVAAMCVGALSLARGIGDPELGSRLIRATRSAVFQLKGWASVDD